MKRLLMLSLLLSACSTMPRDQTSKEFTSKDKKVSFKNVNQSLIMNGFSIMLTDESNGLIKAQKNFIIKRGLLNLPAPAKAIVQVMINDGKAITVIYYDCNYATDGYGGHIETTCLKSDREATKAIAEFEPQLITMLAEATK